MPEPENGGTPAPGTPAPGTPASPAGGTSGTPAPGSDREKWIPRERFDEVNSEVQSLKQQVAYLSQQQVQPASEVPAGPQQPVESDGIPKDYRSWEEWHAVDPGAAIDFRSRQAYHQERQKTEFQTGRQQFLSEVYSELPELKDPMKRNSNPVYQQFTKLLAENPAASTTAAGLRQIWKLAKVESGMTKEQIEAARVAGARSEQERQALVDAGHTPAGTGTPPFTPAPGAPKLTPDQQRIAAKYGMSPEEYAKKSGNDAPQRISMKYERAKRG